MKFLCKLGAITLYLGCMYIALGPAAGNIFTLKDVAVFAVGCAVFFFGASVRANHAFPVDGREIIRDSLSKREMEVALLIAEGHTNIEIGQKLFISPFTVKKHAYNIFAKLNVQQRSEIKYLLDSRRVRVSGSQTLRVFRCFHSISR